jgi:hypothetical protein
VRALALVLSALPALFACGSSCPRESEDTAKRFTGGTTSPDREHYETNSWDESFVDFPAGRRWALVHGLRETPIDLKSYVAFKSKPLPKDGKGFVAESAGNQVLIEGVDEETIRVRNDTCEHFYLRLVASAVPAPDASTPDGSGGAGGSP